MTPKITTNQIFHKGKPISMKTAINILNKIPVIIEFTFEIFDDWVSGWLFEQPVGSFYSHGYSNYRLFLVIVFILASLLAFSHSISTLSIFPLTMSSNIVFM